MALSEEAIKLKKKARASLALLLVAVISISTATYAWFTLSNSATVQSMEVKVGTGTKLMVSTSNSGNGADPWNGYVSELTTEMVDEALNRNLSYRLTDVLLWPLTSGNGTDLYTQGGNAATAKSPVDASTKYYLELNLWFRSSVDMNVYLNGEDSGATADDKTEIVSHGGNDAKQAPVDRAVRLSFESEGGGTVIYEPNKDGDTALHGHAATDGGSTQQTFGSLGTNAGTESSETVFTLKADTPKQVTLRLWLEGEDPQCVNGNGTGTDKDINLEKARLLAQLRFCGADNSGKFIENTVA